MSFFKLLALLMVSAIGASVFHIQPRHGSKRYVLTTFPHMNLGAGANFPPLIDAEAWMMDCIYLKCLPPCPTGRRLGHGGPACGRRLSHTLDRVSGRGLGHGGAAALTAPGAWLPDPSANNTDFCDFRTMISPLSKQVVGLMFFNGWWMNCLLIPKTVQPLVWARDSGLSGLIFLNPAATTDPVMGMGMVPVSDFQNPVPDFPFLTASDQPQSMLPSSYQRSRDNASMIGAIGRVIQCSPQAVGGSLCVDFAQLVELSIRVRGGDSKPSIALSQRCGPLGVNAKNIAADIGKLTAKFSEFKVMVKVSVQNRKASVDLLDTTSSLIFKELKEPARDRKKVKNIKHNGSISFETVKSIAKTMSHKSNAKSMQGTILMILGTCVSMGAKVDGKDPKEITKMVKEGELE